MTPSFSEIANKAFRDVCLVLTGWYPENLDDTAQLNKDTAMDIIESALKAVVEEQRERRMRRLLFPPLSTTTRTKTETNIGHTLKM